LLGPAGALCASLGPRAPCGHLWAHVLGIHFGIISKILGSILGSILGIHVGIHFWVHFGIHCLLLPLPALLPPPRICSGCGDKKKRSSVRWKRAARRSLRKGASRTRHAACLCMCLYVYVSVNVFVVYVELKITIFNIHFQLTNPYLGTYINIYIYIYIYICMCVIYIFEPGPLEELFLFARNYKFVF
jgi:hypothetical protein